MPDPEFYVDSYSSFADIAVLAPAFPESKQWSAALLDAASRVLKGDAHDMEASLRWVVAAMKSERHRCTGPIVWMKAVAPEFCEGPVRVPANYHVYLHDTAWRELNELGIWGESPGEPSATDHGWLIYYAHNHGDRPPRLLVHRAEAGGKLWATAHAVVLETPAGHWWVWISAPTLPRPEKLRWPSIAGASFLDATLVAVDLVTYGAPNPHRTIVVDTDSGLLGQLREDNAENTSSQRRVDPAVLRHALLECARDAGASEVRPGDNP